MYLTEVNPRSSFARQNDGNLLRFTESSESSTMASKSATKTQLQQVCRRLNLDSNGPAKATLLKRLEEHAKKNAAAFASADEGPSAESYTECDEVLAKQTDMGGEE